MRSGITMLTKLPVLCNEQASSRLLADIWPREMVKTCLFWLKSWSMVFLEMLTCISNQQCHYRLP